ncbi:hypothetical protein N7539_000727 [Penicillium diatomitis]|uniref:Uncharacterized protein n=1 Tax=Penicillium diatomitis TaxID=2819901 RepID=A0A9X0C2M0_9EURO|nr:uncharacterized protein N7539_000727 [Penicillium diatomitis]KAJ5495611.1 hypothetical protein N7539_000727 [Penicillium diatomitis]
MSNPSFTDAEWRRLLARLRKQKRLLQKRAGDFITRDYKEVAELEELERREAKESERLEKERTTSK